MKPESVSFAKITQPKFSGVFLRKRLFSLLDRYRKRPAIWVCGPPGAGKTTLVSTYIEQRRLPCIWYQIDEGDKDIASFFHYMGIAARQAAPRYRKPMPLLTPEYLPGLQTFTRNYFRELYSRLNPSVSPLAKGGIKRGVSKSRFVIVLDNYHEAPADSPLHGVIQNGLSEISKGINVVIVSRNDPPPAMARLQASDNFTMLGWDDLRTTEDESIGIAKKLWSCKKRPSKEIMHAIYEKTQGWAAGLVLMLENLNISCYSHESGNPVLLQAQDDRVGTGMTGQQAEIPDAIFSYFASEIFQRADKQIQEFLLKTAFLPKTTAGMAEQLTGLYEAGKIFTALNSKNYFTIKNPLPVPAYEYHPLFRSFLLNQARQQFTPTEIMQLQHRAAAILERAGQIEDAVALYRDAADWASMAGLIINHAQAIIAQGRSKTLKQWIKQLPQAVVDETPYLLYWLGICQMAFNPSQARICLEQAYRIFKDNGERIGLLRSWCAVIEAFIYEWANFKPMIHWVDEMERALADDPTLPSELEGQVACSMFMGLMYSQPQHPKMSYWADRVWQIVGNSQNMLLCVKIAPHLVLYHSWWSVDLAKAEVILKTLRPHIDRASVPPLARITWYVMSATFYWMIAATDNCIASVDKGLELANETGIHIWDMFLCATGVFATLFNEKADRAERYFHQMEAMLVHSRTLDANWYSYLNTARYLFRNELSKAHENIQISVTSLDEGGWIWAAPHAWIGYGLVLFYEERREDAIAMVRKARDINASLYLSPTHEVLSYLIEAEFALQEGNEAACLNLLRSFLAIGKRYNLFYWPWWRSAIMARLCAKALEHNIEPDYVQELIKKRNLFSESPPVDIENWPWKIKVFTLGSFGLVREGRQVNFSRKAQQRPLAMLKALIASGGRNITEGQLIDILWPDTDGDSAHRAFKITLHRLRSLIGTKAVSYSDRKVTLNNSYFWADIWALERILGYSDRALKEGNKEKAIELIEKAAAMYHGSFLAGDAEEPWLMPVRQRLKSKFIRYIEKLCRLYEEKGEFNKAIDSLKKGIEIDALSEEFYQRLMACYQRLGRRAEAIAVYNNLKNTLSAILKISPSSKTEEIYDAIRQER